MPRQFPRAPLCLLFLLAATLSAATLEQVPIGGGGNVTGIVVHPLDATIRYLRTDVGGTYRWNEPLQKWEQMSWSMGPHYRQYCTDGIAIDPHDKEVVYICVGNGTGSGKMGIYKSTDRGHHWHCQLEAPFFGNSTLSCVGECIQVDPHDSKTIFCGTRGIGIVYSHDAGATWKRLDAIPANYSYPGKDYGIRSIAFDRSVLTQDNRCRIIYAAVYNVGVYASRDAGASWTLLPQSPVHVRAIETSTDGTLYMTSNNGVWKYKDEQFTDISPKSPKRIYNALAVDSHTSGRLIVCHAATGPNDCMNMNIYLTEDDGRTWTQKNQNIRKHDKLDWWPDYYWSSATADLCFNPQDSRQVWLTDWYGVWHTPDINAQTVDWYSKVRGHEECVTFSAASLPQGPVHLLLGTVDNGLLYYKNIKEYPPSRSPCDIRDIAYSYRHPQTVLLATASDKLLCSHDHGITQTAVSCRDAGIVNKIAVSAANPDNWVVLPNGKPPCATKDGGKSWQTASGTEPNTMSSKWERQNILAADGNDDNVFYYSGKKGLYRSADGGLTFACVNTDIKDFATIHAMPGTAGRLYARWQGRLWQSNDGAKTFAPVPFFAKTSSLAFGKGRNNGRLAMYAVGTPADASLAAGLYISEDDGLHWTLMRASADLSLYSLACGDMQVFGRCYVTASGLGAAVIDIE